MIYDHTSGEIINFMTVDAERVGVFSWYMHDLWMVALQVTLALLILYKNLGLASIAAFVATVAIMLANVPLGSLQEKFQKKLMESKDTRMKATSEILRNMRILKLQGWEMKFLSKITELRKNEQGWLKKYVYTAAVTTFVFWGSPTFVSVVTFGTCMLMGIPLESGKILSALATFRILQEPIYGLPDTISMIAQTKVSLDRIVSFLRLDDLRSDVVEKLPWGSSDTAIEVVDGNFSWDLSSPSPTLQNINLKVFHGMRVAVCGTVGSGKSTLLSCVLGEVPKISGILKVCGTKAYVAQSPWIQSGKIEDNILFGERMDRDRYEKVLEACSLKKDLEILSFGDQTIIGERGINLSGGQKQRIQIARALYQDADIYLFDDPFSAVDAHTGSHLFKTVVYVTHQVEFLPAADLILVMKDGKITQCGKYTDLLNSGTDFMELVGAHKKALSTLDSLDGAAVSNEISVLEQDVNVSDTHGFKEKEASKDEQNGQTDNKSELQGQLVQEEEREKGKVGFLVYWNYITTAYGGALVPFILLAQILFQALQIGSNYWMAWATPISADVEPHVEGTTLIVVYVGLAIGSSFCILARAILLVTAGYKTATILFNKMHFCIFRAPMSFFDSTPSGRILNRASTDQSALDTDIPYQIASFAFILIQLLGIIGVMSQAAWQVFIVFIPVIAISILYQQYYIPSARELSRLVGVCKAPIIQHFAETISGTSTIRSFDQQSRFQETNMKLTDGYSRPKFNIAGAMEWLCFRLDMLSSITFAFSLIFLISIPQGFIDPGLAGLAVTYGLNLNMVQAWMIWNLCNMENKIISVERILQYTCIPCEPSLVVDDNRPDPSWPSYGEVDIQDLKVRYAPHLPLVLRGLTCKFRGGLKTGIVGRTGSGKSTLIQTLFRIVEPTAGQVMIDNINISSIGLHDLRSRLSIIPQDPTMFEGTVRNNLDPLEEYTDEQIWEALDKCQLGDEVRKKEGKLDSKVTENGENWSMGQRQLVCLGRVLLKKSKVLVLDEATASVDTATDNLIQQILRQHFSDSTVITIAHRITSVLDSDMVLLLSQGIPLESGKILSALATFRTLQEPIYNLPDTISMIAQTKVSLDRIVSFLRLDDLRSDVVEKLPWGSSDTAIEVVDGNFSWDLSSPSPTLQNINLKVFHGMRVAVCGTVGSGKSTLLSCVLGEVPKISGILKVCGTKAYVAQSSWIQSGKIEDNILFGECMDRERYEKVLEACSLKKDLEILSFGDQTIIGERGINLSGGQKQRIQIARALYQDADIYLFDDPFSAVDAHTGSHLFKECLLGLLCSKTVVYVTHQVEFLPAADLILVMKDGKITQCGKYADLLNSGADFMELVGAHKKALSTLDSLDGAAVSNEISVLEQDVNLSGAHGFKEKKDSKDEQNGKTDDKSEPQGQLVQEEEREKGKVGFSVYWKCITTAYGGALVPFILLAQILFQALQIGSNYWMVWATPISEDVQPPVEGTTLIAVYVGLAIGSSFCILARAILLVTAGYKTATILFNKMHFCIFRAPMSFFDSTPSGRILNRASTDQSALDTDIPYQIASFAFILIQLLGIIAVMSQAAWQVFVVFIPVIAISVLYQQYYIPSARELSRLVGVCKAPIIQHFAETISGTTTIRSFDQQSRFQETNMKLTDGYSRPMFNIAGAVEWLCFRLDMLSSITFAFSLIFLISIPQGFIDPGLAGLAVTYGLNLNIVQGWMIWNLCNMENKIISVERILQYTCIPCEPSLVVDDNRPDPSWPSYGEVDIQDLKVRYAPHLPLVLRGLTCKFRGGLKTGIVGRTGSGKSTLIQTLFRIVEPTAGQVMIDSINISSIGLHDLRSRLSIIPQDPTMFEGTVRNNLDPLEEYTDEEIWEALDKCQLGDEVRKKEGKLDSKVTENGENWSMGQRQLVCLGRVLLKKSKVLVLDEATASVDTATDNLIQQILRQHFSDSTVITIAHRITSVLDSDMVLLLSQGLIEEYDTPTRLLENKSSSFAQLVAEYTMRSNSSFEKSDDH
ncbi:ABC transporter C family member 3 [Glycine soja]|uniref:ABC-type xenobiotic transporter n=1 Tax=Glycine soja TaxID=3848 RepID=A0A0B2SFT5_GLYSO|nr:ABC transporter C family member 3 [Glycine soja]